MGLTKELARFAVETTYASLPNDAVENAKHFVYETVAACLLGSGSSLGKTIAEVLEKEDPFDEWRMTSDDLIANLQEYAKGVLTSEKVDAVVKVISKLEELDNITTLMDLLSSDRSRRVTEKTAK